MPLLNPITRVVSFFGLASTIALLAMPAFVKRTTDCGGGGSGTVDSPYVGCVAGGTYLLVYGQTDSAPYDSPVDLVNVKTAQIVESGINQDGFTNMDPGYEYIYFTIPSNWPAGEYEFRWYNDGGGGGGPYDAYFFTTSG